MNRTDWHSRAICSNCGWHTYAPFSELFHVPYILCPTCGNKKDNTWTIESMRWEPHSVTPKWYRPSTWNLPGKWLIQPGFLKDTSIIHNYKVYKAKKFAKYFLSCENTDGDYIELCGFCKNLILNNRKCKVKKTNVLLRDTGCNKFVLSPLFYKDNIYTLLQAPKPIRKLMLSRNHK